MASRPVYDADGMVRNVIALANDGNYTPQAGMTLGAAGGAMWSRWNGSSYVAPVEYTASFSSSGSGRTIVSPALAQNERTAVLLCADQSLICNHGVTKYTPSSTKVENFNIYDGRNYRMVDPVLGPTGSDGSFFGRLGDKLIAASIFDRVIFCPVSAGGTSSGDWSQNATNLASRNLIGSCHDRLISGINRLRDVGLTPTAVLFQNGQADASFSVSQATYQANILSMIAKCRAARLPTSVPWFIAQCTMISGATSSTIRAAQSAVVDHANGIWAGPDVDTISTGSRYDGTHLNDAGNDSCATLWKTALDVYF